jgi:hypothetical protein
MSTEETQDTQEASPDASGPAAEFAAAETALAEAQDRVTRAKSALLDALKAGGHHGGNALVAGGRAWWHTHSDVQSIGVGG